MKRDTSRSSVVHSSRKILFTNVSIMEKELAGESFREELLGEAEKVKEARWQFEVDKERYEEFRRGESKMREEVERRRDEAKERREEQEREMERIR